MEDDSYAIFYWSDEGRWEQLTGHMTLDEAKKQRDSDSYFPEYTKAIYKQIC